MAEVWLVERMDGSPKYLTEEQIELERKKNLYVKKVKKLEL